MNGLGSKDANMRRKNADAVLRLTDAEDLKEKAIAALKAATKELPNYREIPEFADKDLRNDGPAADGSHQDIANKLASLGLFDEAAPEMDAAEPTSANSENADAYSLARSFVRGDRGDRGIGFMEPLWRKVPARLSRSSSSLVIN